jgi:nicotinate-nucleotide adenylyltransferase
MKSEISKIGICGGTFDPIHNGHLLVAELVRCHFGLDKVLFIPSGNPPHKKSVKVSDSGHRYKMVEIATESNQYFEALPLEVERKGLTYTVDTLAELHEVCRPDTQFYYIIGADVVMDLLTWRDFKKVFGLTNFISVLRPGYSRKQYDDQIEYLRTSFDIKLETFEIPLIGISSTLIRKQILQGESIKYMVPEKVEQYILDNKLYIEGKK